MSSHTFSSFDLEEGLTEISTLPECENAEIQIGRSQRTRRYFKVKCPCLQRSFKVHTPSFIRFNRGSSSGGSPSLNASKEKTKMKSKKQVKVDTDDISPNPIEAPGVSYIYLDCIQAPREYETLGFMQAPNEYETLGFMQVDTDDISPNPIEENSSNDTNDNSPKPFKVDTDDISPNPIEVDTDDISPNPIEAPRVYHQNLEFIQVDTDDISPNPIEENSSNDANDNIPKPFKGYLSLEKPSLAKSPTILTTMSAGDIAAFHVPEDKRIDRTVRTLMRNSQTGSFNINPMMLSGYTIDCIVDKRMELYSVFRANIEGTDVLETLQKFKGNEFESILFCVEGEGWSNSKHFDICKLLKYAVKRKWEMFCRLILSHSENEENVSSILEVMKQGIEEEAVNCCKAISWFITRQFYKKYKCYLLDVDDIWPAFRCVCTHKKKSKKLMCSSEIQIIVEHEETIPDIISDFHEIPIQKVSSSESKEGGAIHDKIQLAEGIFHFPAKSHVDAKAAKMLFDNHSKLTVISPSSFKSEGYKQDNWAIQHIKCLHLYCRVKHFIPVGEYHFPKHYRGLPTDVIEGSHCLCNNIKVGNKVGQTLDRTGTLGGFLKIKGDTCYLTCAHVIFDPEQLALKNFGINDDQKLWVNVFEPGKNQQSGTLRDVIFKTDNEGGVSIDAALVKITDHMSIDQTDYLSNAKSLHAKHPIHELGMQTPYLNNNFINHLGLCHSTPKPTVKTIFAGAVSGISKSKSEFQIKEGEPYTLEQLPAIYKNTMKENVREQLILVIRDINIQSLSQVPSKEHITEKLNIHLSHKFDNKIVTAMCDIVLEYYTSLKSGIKNLNAEVAELLDIAICREVNKDYSAITGNVHIQEMALQLCQLKQASVRINRRMYGQLYITNIAAVAGDSGSCIYAIGPGNIRGCIGMLIGTFPDRKGCIVTPITKIFDAFGVTYNLGD